MGFVAFCFITGIILSFTYEGAVIRYLQKYLDKHLATELEVGKINLSFLRRFPNASVELRNIMAKSSTDLNKRDFSIKADTLLFARSVFFEFSLTGLIKGDYKLKNISIEDGWINLLTDRKGKTNFDIWEDSSSNDKNVVKVQLQNILFSDVSFRYYNLKNNINIEAKSRKLNLRAEFGEPNQILAKGNIMLNRLGVEKTINYIHKNLFVEIDLSYKDNQYHFNKSYFVSDKSKFTFRGDIKDDKKVWIDLYFNSPKALLSDLPSYFPEQLVNFKNNFSLSGSANISGNVKGFSSSGSYPDVNVNFNISKASVINNNNGKKVTGLSLKGNYFYKMSGSGLKISNFESQLGDSKFSGEFSMIGTDKPAIELSVKSDIYARELAAFLNLDTLENVSGNIESSIHLKGQLKSFKNTTFRELLALNREGHIIVNNLFFKIEGTQYHFTKMNGEIDLENTIKLRNFSFNLGESDFYLNCNIWNFYGHFLNREQIHAEAEIKSSKLNLGELIENENGNDSSKIISFPDSISFKANFLVNELVYNKFTATNISGAVSYLPKTFQFHSFQLNSVEGLITGLATVSQDLQNNTQIDCSASMSKLNIQKLFYSFNNFTQDVILDKNLNGKLSGKVNLTSIWDKNLNLQTNSVEAISDIEIQNGELLNYAPMLGLSKFINVEELKDIKFKTLKNQIIIKDRKVTIPEMAISSSAFSIRGSGIHSFDNNYEYLVQVQLSDLLAKKARKKKKEIDEFGVVEEDGLGINIPVKIIGKGNEFEVAFDRKKAFSIFKNNIAEERKELKLMINDNKDTSGVKNIQDNQNKKFIINWDEGNDKKDFIFEEKEDAPEEESQFIIEWDDEAGTDE